MRDPVGTPPASVAHAATPRATPAGGVPGLLPRFLRFAAVGASGVLVNALLLLWFVEGLHWPILAASLLSIELSTLSNWALNRHWTWKDRDDTLLHSLGKYHGVALVGMALQWLVLAVTLASSNVHYLVGTVLGVAAATAWNFAGSHFFSFRDASARPLPRWALYATSGFAQLVIAAVFAHPWDTFVFQRSVEDLLLRGLTPYQVAEAAPAYTYWGGALPALPMWYAYPPIPLALMSATYFPSALGWVPWGWAGRVLIRLPFIAATLGLAALARRLVESAPGATAATTARAQRAERLLMLNPLVIVIAALWGQFEALILLLLLASVLALRQAKWGRSGAWWALAVCVKIFPLYLVPLLAVHLWRTGGRRALVRFGAVAAAVGAAINVPFLLWSPRGYLQQVFLMHSERAPARLAPLAHLGNFLEMLSETWPAYLPAEQAWAHWLGAVSLVLVVAIVVALAAASRRAPADEGHLLHWMALTFLGGLLATKVLNEQYLVLPIGLLVVAAAHPQRTLAPGITRFLRIASWGIVVAGLAGGFNLLNALPAGLVQTIFGGLAPEVVGRFAFALHVSVSQLRHIVAVTTGLLLLVPGLMAARLLGRPLRDGLLALERGLLARLRSLQHATRPAVLGTLVIVLVALPLGLAVAAGPASGASTQPLADGDRWVLAQVTTTWYNPSNDPALAQGTWGGVAVQPEAGYYTINAHKVQRDLARIEAAGFDGLVITTHPFYEGYAATVRRVAEANDVPYALGVDLGHLPGELVPLEAASANQLRATLERPAYDFWSGRNHIVAPDGGANVVFLSGVGRVQPAFTPAEIAFVLDAWGRAGAAPADVAALAAAPPTVAADLQGDTPLAVHWRAAYEVAKLAWWTQALRTSHDLAFITDAPIPLGSAPWLGPSQVTPSAPQTGPAVRFAALNGVLDPASVRGAWDRVVRADATGVVVPWNDFARGQAVEPTQAHGDTTLRMTKDAIAQFKHPAAPAEAVPDERGLVEAAPSGATPSGLAVDGVRASA